MLESELRRRTRLDVLDHLGRQAEASDHDLADELLDDERLNGKLRRDNMKLLSMVQYVRGEGCRRGHISSYFGFPTANACGNCDRCSLDE